MLKRNSFSQGYFSLQALPYWCMVILDAIGIVVAGMLAVYLTYGGVAVVDSFWEYIYIWIISLPFFLLYMVSFRTYGGVLRRPLLHNSIAIILALFLGGCTLQALGFVMPKEMMPFRPAVRTTAVLIVLASLLQILTRVIARSMFKVSDEGKIIKPWTPRVSVKDVKVRREDREERKRINLCLAHMSEEGMERKYVQEAFDTNWLVPLGPNVNAFEDDLKAFVNNGPTYQGASEVAALSAGTAAVHLALIACGVAAGDEVCVQSFTFCASVNPIVYLGAVPVFIDSEPETWNMDPALLEKAIIDRKAKTGRYPKAIIPVSLYGMPYKADEIMRIANKYGIPVIEDAAEGFGSRYMGRVLGTFGRYGVLSFNGNKMITTSGGGALVCNGCETEQPCTVDNEQRNEVNMYTSVSADENPVEQKNTIMWLATQARDSYPYYQHSAIGFNYRMSNVCAGIGRGQMTVVNDHIAHHKHVQEMYEQLLSDVPGITVHKQPAGRGRVWRNGVEVEVPVYESNYWLCTITIDKDVHVQGQENAYKEVIKSAVGGAAGVIHVVDSPTTDCQPNENVEALRVFMLDRNVEARPVWKPMHCQPAYANASCYLSGVSESLFKVGVCLPAGPMVSDEDVRYIVDCIKEAVS